MMRTIRAFFKALQMTLRGESLPPHPHASLLDWLQQADIRVQAVYSTAKQTGYETEKRQQIRLKLDGRDTNMETVLRSVAFHVREEYPHLLANLTEHSLTAIYAANLNDQYHVARLREHAALADAPALQQAVAALGDHLNAIPPGSET